jgi:hypothetical protein
MAGAKHRLRLSLRGRIAIDIELNREGHRGSKIAPHRKRRVSSRLIRAAGRESVACGDRSDR